MRWSAGAGEDRIGRGIDMDGLDEAMAGQQGAEAAEPPRRQVAMGLDAAHADGGGEGRDGLRVGQVGDEDGLRPRGQGGDDGAGRVRGDLVLRAVGDAAEQAEGGGPGGVGGQGLGGGLGGAEFKLYDNTLTRTRNRSLRH